MNLLNLNSIINHWIQKMILSQNCESAFILKIFYNKLNFCNYKKCIYLKVIDLTIHITFNFFVEAGWRIYIK